MKAKSTLLFGASGSFEELTISKWKKLRVAKHKPSGPGKDASILVAGARYGAKLIADFFHILPDFIRLGYQQYEHSIGWYGEFYQTVFRENYNNYGNEDGNLNITNLKIARGTMLNPDSYTPGTFNKTTGNCTMLWDHTVQYSQLGTDRLYIAVHNSTKDLWFLFPSQAARSAGTTTFHIDTANFSGGFNEWDCYMFFTGAPGTKTEGTNDTGVMFTQLTF